MIALRRFIRCVQFFFLTYRRGSANDIIKQGIITGGKRN